MTLQSVCSLVFVPLSFVQLCGALQQHVNPVAFVDIEDPTNEITRNASKDNASFIAYTPSLVSGALKTIYPVDNTTSSSTPAMRNFNTLFECSAAYADALLRAELAEARLAALIPGEEVYSPGSQGFIDDALLAFGCVVLAAIAAGLSMGLFGIDPMELEIIVKTQEQDMMSEADKEKLKEDKKAAAILLPLIRDHHRLLVTLLLINCIANEALPLFLDEIVPAWLAITLSVTFVLVFCEILPSALLLGQARLRLCAQFAGIISTALFVFAPIAIPVGKVLDALLGADHKGRYNFAELRALVGLHAIPRHNTGGLEAIPIKSHDQLGRGIITMANEHHFDDLSVVVFTSAPGEKAKSTKLRSDGTLYFVKRCLQIDGTDKGDTLQLYTTERRFPEDLITFSPGELTSGALREYEHEELKILQGVMQLTHKRAKDAMVPLSDVAMLDTKCVLDLKTLEEILERGYSRLPVYDRYKHNLRGFILVKRMIVINPEHCKTVGDIAVEKLVVVDPNLPMLDLLNQFQESKCHLALITNAPSKVLEAWEKKIDIPPDVHMAGIITLEDVIEQLLQEEIYDEVDHSCRSPVRRQSSSPTMRLKLPGFRKVTT